MDAVLPKTGIWAVFPGSLESEPNRMRHPTVSAEPLTPRMPELSDLASRYSQGQQAGTMVVDRQRQVVTRLSDRTMTAATLRALRRTLSTFSL